ncbi:uncharacterized protein LOC115629887 [Scaptodrosophila lebanonensis]|uniref:Uncharacterized protein LOC115629887 n=1 Tax=Drosophila lebanonensis TaxID=7225 RepID=A0A6J2U0Y5_DROLE|nr:uncharacterized protein LOC115629887 [Scaptodrosophila lebanonensis]
MIHISTFHERACFIMRHYFRISANNCEDYSIWAFNSYGYWLDVKQHFVSCLQCTVQWFPFVFWFVLSLSIVGVLHSIIEFIRLYCKSPKPVSMWRPRCFYTFSDLRLRRCRLLGTFLMIKAWMLLLYAVITISPNYMGPWLVFNATVLALDFVVWCIEVLCGTQNVSIRSILSFLLPLISQYLVRCVKNVFEQALILDEADKLSFWS